MGGDAAATAASVARTLVVMLPTPTGRSWPEKRGSGPCLLPDGTEAAISVCPT